MKYWMIGLFLLGVFYVVPHDEAQARGCRIRPLRVVARVATAPVRVVVKARRAHRIRRGLPVRHRVCGRRGCN